MKVDERPVVFLWWRGNVDSKTPAVRYELHVKEINIGRMSIETRETSGSTLNHGLYLSTPQKPKKIKDNSVANKGIQIQKEKVPLLRCPSSSEPLVKFGFPYFPTPRRFTSPLICPYIVVQMIIQKIPVSVFLQPLLQLPPLSFLL